MMFNGTPKVLRKASYADLSTPLLAVVGPLLGLAYIIVLPFIGAMSLLYFAGHRGAQMAATIWRRIVPVDAR